MDRPGGGSARRQLYCKNRNVDAENEARLAALAGAAQPFDAVDVFGGTALHDAKARQQVSDAANGKAAAVLRLKVGAQVVLTRNLDPSARLVNGSRGVVVRFEAVASSRPRNGGYGYVHRPGHVCPVVRFDVGVSRRIGFFETWVGRGALGSVSRTQVPLKLAWALTVHKVRQAVHVAWIPCVHALMM